MRTRWTYELLMDVARKYLTFKDFRRDNNDAYLAARRNDWVKDIKEILLSNVTKWSDKNIVFQEAKKYTTRNEFRKKAKGAYEACVKNKWLNEACEHMLSRKIWTKEDCILEAKNTNGKVISLINHLALTLIVLS
jgi:hypothetical protein